MVLEGRNVATFVEFQKLVSRTFCLDAGWFASRARSAVVLEVRWKEPGGYQCPGSTNFIHFVKKSQSGKCKKVPRKFAK